MQSDLGKLFIGGISWETDEEGLKEYFSTYGEVVEAVIMKDRTTGRARGFGFIVFSDPSAADRVVLEKHNIDGRMVEAKKAVPRDDQSILSRNSGSMQGSPGPVRTRKIFVGGLASTVTENSFKKYFEQFGTITDVVVMYDHNTKRPRGFGFITFDSEEAVDRVLIKSFHELNGKMVEVKRAVPKELSPGPARSPLPGYSYGLSRVNNLLNGFTQGYNPGNLGGYGVRMDGRFSTIANNRSGFSQFGSTFGMGMNFEPGMNPNYGGNGNYGSNISYGRGLNPYTMGNSNGFVNPAGCDGGNGGSSSFFSSSRNLWGNGALSYGSNSANSNNFSGTGSSLAGRNLGNNNANWGNLSGQGGSNPGNHTYGVSDGRYNLSGLSYGRNHESNAAPTPSSYAPSVGGYNGALSDFYGNDSVYGVEDSSWKSPTPERDGSSSLAYTLGNTSSDINTKGTAGYVGGYSINKRLPNRGIAT